VETIDLDNKTRNSREEIVREACQTLEQMWDGGIIIKVNNFIPVLSAQPYGKRT